MSLCSACEPSFPYSSYRPPSALPFHVREVVEPPSSIAPSSSLQRRSVLRLTHSHTLTLSHTLSQSLPPCVDHSLLGREAGSERTSPPRGQSCRPTFVKFTTIPGQERGSTSVDTFSSRSRWLSPSHRDLSPGPCVFPLVALGMQADHPNGGERNGRRRHRARACTRLLRRLGRR